MAAVDDAMLTVVKTCGPATTVGQVRAMFTGGHVHAALVLDGGRLSCVVDHGDVTGAAAAIPDGVAARTVGRLEGRTVLTGTPLDRALELMELRSRRRLAVVDGAGRLLGLLCLKRHGRGFCSDSDVLDRVHERSGRACAP